MLFPVLSGKCVNQYRFGLHALNAKGKSRALVDPALDVRQVQAFDNQDVLLQQLNMGRVTGLIPFNTRLISTGKEQRMCGQPGGCLGVYPGEEGIKLGQGMFNGSEKNSLHLVNRDISHLR